MEIIRKDREIKNYSQQRNMTPIKLQLPDLIDVYLDENFDKIVNSKNFFNYKV